MASPHVIWRTSLALTGLEVYDVVSDIWNNLTLRSIPNETIHDAVGWLNFHLMTVMGLNLLLFFLWVYLRSGPGWRLVRAEFGPQAVRLLDLVSFFNAGCQRIPIEHAIKFTEAASDSELRQHTEGESLSRGELLQELYKLKSQLERVALVPRFYEDVIQTGFQLYIVYVQLQLGESLKASQWMSLAGSTFNFYAAAGCEDAAFRDLVSMNLLADLLGVASLLSRCYLCAAIGDELIQELQHLRGFPVLFLLNPAVFILPATFASESLARLYGFQGKRLGDERRDARKHHFDAGIHVGAGGGFLCRVAVLLLIAFLFKLDYFEVSTGFLWTLVDFANSCEVSSREPAASKKVQEVCCVCPGGRMWSTQLLLLPTLANVSYGPDMKGPRLSRRWLWTGSALKRTASSFSENRPFYKRAGGGMNLFYYHNRSVAATRDQWLLSPDMPAFYKESVEEFKDAASGSVSPTSMNATEVRTWSRQTGSVHSLPNYTSFVLTSLEDHPFRGTWLWSEGTTIRWGLLFSSKRRQRLHHGRPVLELVKPFDNGTKAKSFRISFSHEHGGWALKENRELRFLRKAVTAFPFDEPSDDFKELEGWHKWEGGQCAQATRPLLIGKACHPQCLGCTGAGNKRCCTAACSGHQCPADYVLKKNAAELAGTADDICCLKWYLQAKSWRELDAVSTKPPKRSGHTAVYDPQGKAMVIFGGPALGVGMATARAPGLDSWKSAFFAAACLPAKTWHEVDVGSTKPPARNYHTAVYDPQGKAMVIFGGPALGVPPRPPSLLAFLSPSARGPGYDGHGPGPGPRQLEVCLLCCCLLAGCCWASWSPDPCTDQDRLDDSWAFDLA
ncbi:unnamed protein product, partial [Symbiodinium sp. CCMP2456]